MEKVLLGKKILFIAFDFYKYNYRIKDAMELLGAKVDMLDQAHYSTAYSFLFRLGFDERYMNSFRKKILSKCNETKYDCIVVLEIKQPNTFYAEIRRMQPQAKMVLYYWDSLSYFDYRPFMKHFDRVCSFDIKDTQENADIKYLPLFFVDSLKDIRKSNNECKYDLMYIASYSDEKYQQIQELLAMPEFKKLRSFIYLKDSFLRYLSYKILRRDTSMIYAKELSFSEMSALTEQTRCVVDFTKTIQTGLSMRTFETLGSYRKLITTNENVRQEPIYSPQNVFVLGKDDISKLPEFCQAPFYKDPVIEKYSLTSWVKSLIIDE